MNIEQLKKGNELSEKIKRIEVQINKWKEARGVFEITFTNKEFMQTEDIRNVETFPIDFDVLKTLSLKTLEEVFERTKKEFEEL